MVLSPVPFPEAPQSRPPDALLKTDKEFCQSGRFQDSRNTYNKPIGLSIEARYRAEEFYGLGVVDYEQGDAAAKNFRRSTAFDPFGSNSYYFLGEIFEKQHCPEEVEGFFRKALDINPGHKGAQQRLGALRPAIPAQHNLRQHPVRPQPLGQCSAEPSAASVGGVYDIIRSDQSALGKQTAQLIDSLAFSRSQRLSAFIRPISRRVFGLFIGYWKGGGDA